MVNNEGIVEAASVGNVGGQLVLQGDVVTNLGTLSASGGSIDVAARSLLQAGEIHADATVSGNAGRVTLAASGALVQTEAARITANAASGHGGTVRVDGGDSAFVSGTLQANGTTGGSVTLTASNLTLSGASLAADGTATGGSVRVGGDAHGASLSAGTTGLANAKTTQVNTTTTLSAAGDNGKVVVWSDDKTSYAGNASTGPKGFIEISGKGDLVYKGTANPGPGGNLLLDPTNIVIDTAPVTSTDYIVLADPNPAAGDQHGTRVTALSGGNIVVTNGTDAFGGANAGAAYLYNGTTGALISALYGSAGDRVGSFSVTALNNGNYVIASTSWNNGSATGAGAVTWGNGTTGISGTVSGANSLVGSHTNDAVGSSVTALTNGNYVVGSSSWDNGGTANVGAATWGSGAVGVSGVITSSNSLIGTNANDSISNSGVTALTNGNYVVKSNIWTNGSVGGAGAATWGSGTAGVSGPVSSSNSLVGSNASDQVGTGVRALTNGNYVVISPSWQNGSATYAGAVTWGNGTSGVSGAVSSSNSLVGSTTSDGVGNNGVAALSNGNYVVSSLPGRMAPHIP